MDLQAPRRREVPRRRVARRQRRRRLLCPPVGHQEPAAQGPRQLVRLLARTLGWLPQPARFVGRPLPRTTWIGGAAPAAPPIVTHRDPRPEGVTPPVTQFI